MSDHVSLIIPAYNEATRIPEVLDIASASTCVDEIIVVDDGSTDDTAKVAAEYGLTLLQHEVNQGKGEALNTGCMYAKELGSTALLFLDADLHNINTDHIDSLIHPVLSGDATMTIGILERTRLQKAFLSRWGAFSGQRALPISLWESVDPQYRRGYGIEAVLNATSRHLGRHGEIQRIQLAGLTHTGKREKMPTLAKAAMAYARTYGAALLTYARLH